jgi:hypothetical protein
MASEARDINLCPVFIHLVSVTGFGGRQASTYAAKPYSVYNHSQGK